MEKEDRKQYEESREISKRDSCMVAGKRVEEKIVGIRTNRVGERDS